MAHLKTAQGHADLLKGGKFEERERWDNIKIEDDCSRLQFRVVRKEPDGG
jgi:hypothetical protein